MTFSSKTLSAAIIAVAFVAIHAASVSAASVYSGGHGDIGVAYEGPSGFFVHVHAGTNAIVDGSPLPNDEEFAGPDVIIQVPGSAKIGRNHVTLDGSLEEYDFTAASYNFLGTGAGDNLWLVFPDSADSSSYGGPFLGLATEELLPGEWTGPAVFRLTGFSGPGEFSLFTSGGTRRWDTQDSNFANDTLNIGIGGHSHFFFGFTAPGIYEVEVTVTGNHIVDGPVMGTETFTFQVVPEPSSAVLLAIAAPAMGLALLRLRNRRQKLNG